MKKNGEIIKRREYKELYTDLVEKAAIAIEVDDREGNIIFYNTAAAEILGYTVDELKGKTIQALTHPDDLEMAMNYHKGRIAGENVPSRYEFKAIKKDGSTIQLEIIATAQRKNGEIIGTRCYLWDITQRKKTEEELIHALEVLRKTSYTLIHVIGNMLEMRDSYTANHHHRVADLARAIAEELGLSKDIIDGIRLAGLIHDVGKISIPAEILTKPTHLSEQEFSLIKNHPLVSHELLKGLDFPWPIAQIVLQHHERTNGSGYPAGLKNDDILLEAKILAVADVVEAMSSHRPYRASLGIDKALEEISMNKGILYDAKVVDACLRVFKEKGFRFRVDIGDLVGPAE